MEDWSGNYKINLIDIIASKRHQSETVVSTDLGTIKFI